MAVRLIDDTYFGGSIIYFDDNLPNDVELNKLISKCSEPILYIDYHRVDVRRQFEINQVGKRRMATIYFRCAWPNASFLPEDFDILLTIKNTSVRVNFTDDRTDSLHHRTHIIPIGNAHVEYYPVKLSCQIIARWDFKFSFIGAMPIMNNFSRNYINHEFNSCDRANYYTVTNCGLRAGSTIIGTDLGKIKSVAMSTRMLWIDHKLPLDFTRIKMHWPRGERRLLPRIFARKYVRYHRRILSPESK